MLDTSSRLQLKRVCGVKLDESMHSASAHMVSWRRLGRTGLCSGRVMKAPIESIVLTILQTHLIIAFWDSSALELSSTRVEPREEHDASSNKGGTRLSSACAVAVVSHPHA